MGEWKTVVQKEALCSPWLSDLFHRKISIGILRRETKGPRQRATFVLLNIPVAGSVASRAVTPKEFQEHSDFLDCNPCLATMLIVSHQRLGILCWGSWLSSFVSNKQTPTAYSGRLQ